MAWRVSDLGRTVRNLGRCRERSDAGLSGGQARFRGRAANSLPLVPFDGPFGLNTSSHLVNLIALRRNRSRRGASKMDFTYHKKLSPIVGMLLALACAETIVIRIIATAAWGWKIAIAIGLVDISLIIVLVRMIRSFRKYPITLRNGVVTMKTGRRLHVATLVNNIAAFRTTWSADDLKARLVLNMALSAWPTIVFDLKTSFQRRGKSMTTIAHCVDEPEKFQQMIGKLLQHRSEEMSIA